MVTSNPTPSRPTPPQHREVTILTMGGTIDKVYSLAGQMEIAPPAAREILDQANVTDVAVEPVLAKDSLDLTDTDRDQLLQYLGHVSTPGVVITHGTDTLTVTAEHLLGNAATLGARTIVSPEPSSPRPCATLTPPSTWARP